RPALRRRVRRAARRRPRHPRRVRRPANRGVRGGRPRLPPGRRRAAPPLRPAVAAPVRRLGPGRLRPALRRGGARRPAGARRAGSHRTGPPRGRPPSPYRGGPGAVGCRGPLALLARSPGADGGLHVALTLSLLYRGPLSSCNYDCGYCPFAKRRETAAELARDRTALGRFVDWVAAR